MLTQQVDVQIQLHKKITINEAPRTCDFIATPDYASGFYGMKVEPMNGSGIVGGQQSVNYVWVFEGGGTKKTSDKNAATSYDFPTDGTYKVTMRAKNATNSVRMFSN